VSATSSRLRHRIRQSPSLNLAPMIDIFTVLLIFLILTFVTDEKSVNLSEGVELPEASVELKDIPGMQVEISKNEFLLNGEAKSLRDIKSAFKGKAPVPVLIVAHQNLDFGRIQSVLTALTESGFTQFQFLTSKPEELK